MISSYAKMDSYDEDDGEADFYRCLHYVVNAAFLYRTPLLWAKSRRWGIEGEEAEGAEEEMLTPSDGGEPYPAHPYCLSLVHNVFTSAVAFIDTILAPDSVVVVRGGVVYKPILTLPKDEKEAEESPVQQVAAEAPTTKSSACVFR